MALPWVVAFHCAPNGTPFGTRSHIAEFRRVLLRHLALAGGNGVATPALVLVGWHVPAEGRGLTVGSSCIPPRVNEIDFI